MADGFDAERALRALTCATPREIDGWLRKHRTTEPGEQSRRLVTVFCGDCTLAYAAAMHAEGRCIRDGRPRLRNGR